MRTWLLSCILALFSCTFAFAQGDENWDDQFGIPGTDGTVWAIAIDGDDIYVGGTFTKVGTIEANNLAKWNYATKHGQSLATQGNLIAHPIPYGIVNTIKVHGDEVFIGGNFSQLTVCLPVILQSGTKALVLGQRLEVVPEEC